HADPWPAAGNFCEPGKSSGWWLGLLQPSGHPRESQHKASNRTLMLAPARSAIRNRPQGFNIARLKPGFYALLCFWLLAGSALAQKPTHPASEENLALIARAAEHERAELENPKQYRYQERLDWNWGSETRSVIETLEGRADRIVLFN